MKKTGGIFMSIATEIVTMKTLQEVTKDSFISIVDSLETVSYTHLDVYKRQVIRQADSQTYFLQFV